MVRSIAVCRCRRWFAAVIPVGFLLGGISSAGAAGISTGTLAPVQNTLDSTNWSGYAAVAGTGQQFASVAGSWTVPTVTGPSTGDAYSSVWIGIDGLNSSTVEQIGTAGDISNGVVSYYAWYEFFPGPGYLIDNFTITPGDHMTSLVRYDGPSADGYDYYLSLLDTTSGVEASGTISIASSGANSSAEWIVEAPTVAGSQSALADVGMVSFSDATATLAGGSDTGIGGLDYTSIDLVDSSGVVAQTSVLGSDGSSFEVARVPEPGTLGMLGVGALALLRRRRPVRGD